MSAWPFGSWNLGSLLPGDAGISQTVSAIKQAVAFSLRQPEVRAQAESIVANEIERDERAEVEAIFRWVVEHFRYVKDPVGIELVKSPEISLREIHQSGQFQGDCDDVTALLAALLKAVGYTVRAVTISVPGKGHQFRHIYLKVYLPKARKWLSLEGTARKRPIGFEAANERFKTYPL